jgi:hypothetical protein
VTWCVVRPACGANATRGLQATGSSQSVFIFVRTTAAACSEQLLCGLCNHQRQSCVRQQRVGGQSKGIDRCTGQELRQQLQLWPSCSTGAPPAQSQCIETPGGKCTLDSAILAALIVACVHVPLVSHTAPWQLHHRHNSYICVLCTVCCVQGDRIYLSTNAVCTPGNQFLPLGSSSDQLATASAVVNCAFT